MVFEKLQEIIAEQLSIDASEVKLDTNFENDLKADSLDLFQVINEIEDEFDISIDTDRKVETVQDLVAYVEELTK